MEILHHKKKKISNKDEMAYVVQLSDICCIARIIVQCFFCAALLQAVCSCFVISTKERGLKHSDRIYRV